MKAQILVGSVLGTAMLASAHLGALTVPKANDTFTPGATVNVTWSVATAHDTQDLAYSVNGTNWINITTGLGRSVKTFAWTVPDINSSTVRLRVCQRDGGGGCTDAHNTQALSNGIPLNGGGEVYTAIVGNFKVGSTSAVRAGEDATMPRIGFNAASRSVDLSFRMEKAGKVILEAFDTQGRLLATLLDTEKGEGAHALSVFSHRLPASGAAVLRLQAGHQAIQTTFNLAR